MTRAGDEARTELSNLEMSKSQAFQWRAACWVAVTGFVALAAWFGWGMHQLFAAAARPGSMGLMCGNSVTDPLAAILSLGTPVSLVAASGLLVLSWRGSAGRWSAASAAVLAVVCTSWLVAFGINFFRDALPGFHLSDVVWWLKPFGKLSGI